MDVLRNYSVTVFPLCAGVIGELGGAIVDDLSVSPVWGLSVPQFLTDYLKNVFPLRAGVIGLKTITTFMITSVSPAWGYRETQTRHYINERYFPFFAGLTMLWAKEYAINSIPLLGVNGP